MKRSAHIAIIEPDEVKSSEINRFLKAGSDNFLFTTFQFDSVSKFENDANSKNADAIVIGDLSILKKAKVFAQNNIPLVVFGDKKTDALSKIEYTDFLAFNKLNLYHLPKVIDRILSLKVPVSITKNFTNQHSNKIDLAIFETFPKAALIFEKGDLCYSNQLARPYLNSSIFSSILDFVNSNSKQISITNKGAENQLSKTTYNEYSCIFAEEIADHSTSLIASITKMADELSLIVYRDDKLVFKNDRASQLIPDASIFTSFDEVFKITIDKNHQPVLNHISSSQNFYFSIEELNSINGKYQILSLKEHNATSISNTLQNALVHSLSHDFREPIRTCTSYIQLLKAKTDDKEQLEFIDIISKEVKRLDHLILNLKQVFTPSSINPIKEKIASRGVIENSLKDLKTQIEDIDAIVDLSELPEIYADKKLISQVFKHLLENAIQNRKPQKRCFIEIVGFEHEDKTLICVKDNGVGIDSKYHQKIFEPFTRLDSNKAESGSGLGLHIAKSIIEGHGGEIWVESHEGFGSSFFISLPK
jgi:signal transduction histidine kinase